MSKSFAIGTTVSIAKRITRDFYVDRSVLGQKGTVETEVTNDGLQRVFVPAAGFAQYVPTEDLKVVQAAPKATKQATFSRKSQCGRILAFLLAGNSLTPVKAVTLFGAYRLAARICELRQAGHKIVSVNKTDINGKVYAEYSLRQVNRFGDRKVAA